MSKESSPKIKEIVSLMHNLLTAYNISKTEHYWETPKACGKVVTGHKDDQNNLIYSLRRLNLTPICTISNEVINNTKVIIINGYEIVQL